MTIYIYTYNDNLISKKLYIYINSQEYVTLYYKVKIIYIYL